MTRKVFLKAMVTVVALLGLLVFPNALSAQGNSEAAFNRVKAVQEANTDALMAINGVVGTAIGLGQNAQPILLVLLANGGVPNIPASLGGVQVRPLLTGTFYASDKPGPNGHDHGGGDDPPPDDDPPSDPSPTERWPRPVPIGVSTGHPVITAGTIGCRVTDGANVYALSCNHVYALENQASTGDAVIQPGTEDGGSSPADDIGTLDDFEPWC